MGWHLPYPRQFHGLFVDGLNGNLYPYALCMVIKISVPNTA